MWKLIKFIFTGNWHEHKWKIIDQYKYTQIQTKKVIEIVYVLQCEICGDIKIKEID